MDAWMLAPLTKDGYPEYKVEINGILSESSFKPQKDNWQSLALTDIKKSASTIKLRKEENIVSVIVLNMNQITLFKKMGKLL